MYRLSTRSPPTLPQVVVFDVNAAMAAKVVHHDDTLRVMYVCPSGDLQTTKEDARKWIDKACTNREDLAERDCNQTASWLRHGIPLWVYDDDLGVGAMDFHDGEDYAAPDPGQSQDQGGGGGDQEDGDMAGDGEKDAQTYGGVSPMKESPKLNPQKDPPSPDDSQGKSGNERSRSHAAPSSSHKSTSSSQGSPSPKHKRKRRTSRTSGEEPSPKRKQEDEYPDDDTPPKCTSPRHKKKAKQ